MNSKQQTVHDVTYDLLRKLELTTVFGNPGSTEQPFLKNFPADFKYVLGLQEASAVAMADGYAQATKKPVLVNLHSSAGMGNGMGNIIGAFMNRTPLIITAGQQTRAMVLGETYLANQEATMLPKPWVKWSYEPARAQDVPAALMRAYAVAMQPPAGPVFLSIPMDDWDQPALGAAVVRTVSTRVAPDPERLKKFADKMQGARNPVLIYGPELEKAGGWETGIRFAEKFKAPVYLSPLADKISFPLTHPQCRGTLPMAIGPLSDRLKGFDLAIVVGAQVFRYYPYVEGNYLPEGTQLIQFTADPHDASTAFVGDSILGDPKLALDMLMDMIPQRASSVAAPAQARPTGKVSDGRGALFANEVFATLSEVKPTDAILVAESASNTFDLLNAWPISKPDSFYMFASGGLGWGAPAAVGVALALKTQKTKRSVIAVIGDGALQYSVQSLYTAAREKLPVVFVVPRNGEYGILKDFAVLEDTPHVPGLDLEGLDISSTAKGFGWHAVDAKTKAELKEVFLAALKHDGPTVITVPVQSEQRALA